MKWFLLCLLSSASAAQEVLRLEEAITLAMENNRGLQFSSSIVDEQEAAAGEAAARLYPGLSFLGGYTRLEEGAFRLSTTNQPQPLAVGDVVENNFVFRLGLRQPLFTGFRLSGLSEAADLQLTAARQDHSMLREDLVYGVTVAYWNLYQAVKVESLAGENVEQLAAYRRDTEALMANGLATRNDLLRIDVRLSNATIERLEAENNTELARMKLNTMIGRPARDRYDLLSTPMDPGETEIDRVSQNVDQLVGIATHNRPDLLAAETRSLAAAQLVGAAGGAYWPQVELTANYQYNNPNSRYQPITPEFLSSWDVGVTMLFDLWNWGETGSKVEQAEAGLRRTDIHRMQLMEDVILEINEAVLLLKQSREKMAVASLALSQAAENLRVTSEKYREGSATSTELLDAELELFKAGVQRSSAEVEHTLARARLRRSIGAGTPDTQPR